MKPPKHVNCRCSPVPPELHERGCYAVDYLGDGLYGMVRLSPARPLPGNRGHRFPGWWRVTPLLTSRSARHAIRRAKRRLGPDETLYVPDTVAEVAMIEHSRDEEQDRGV